MKKINLIYWNEKNFGDALNPKLVKELTGIDPQYKYWIAGRKKWLTTFFQTILKFDLKNLKTIILPWQRTYICVGSIINRSTTKSIVWGAGFMNEYDEFGGGETFAVRGPFTNEKLKQLGFPGCEVYGDPALLLPLWITPVTERKFKLGIIPHWKEVDSFKEKYGERYHIIDLRTDNMEQVINEICSCEYIVSTSLHGVIVGQAYEIPSLWIKKGHIDTDGFKFRDYFSSVNIPLYDGFENIEEILSEEENWIQLFQDNRDKTLIVKSLPGIQSGLLKAAPFPLKEKYRRFLQ